MELQRNLREVSKERDTLSQSNTRLRESLRSADTERISMKRPCEEEEAELRNNLREVETSRLEVRRELQELQTCRSGEESGEEPLNQMAAVSGFHLEVADATKRGVRPGSVEVKQEETPILDASYVANLTTGPETALMRTKRPPPNPNINPYRGQGPYRGGPPGRGRGRGRGMPPRTHTRCQLPPWEHGNGYDQ
ncbi:unnamed protein product [Pleuronectes platessa]|uniref:Uncharacterized protein n=1 Tax=Pleuronectes platessa TaxID=8262 RepID=A0A9N7UX38_PLEPL|nr:unnamed protein product [Pleuronectes platessa]